MANGCKIGRRSRQQNAEVLRVVHLQQAEEIAVDLQHNAGLCGLGPAGSVMQADQRDVTDSRAKTIAVNQGVDVVIGAVQVDQPLEDDEKTVATLANIKQHLAAVQLERTALV